ncbi:MAG: hypothetical protein ACLTTO_11200 [Lachnospiraceae bacterium]
MIFRRFAAVFIFAIENDPTYAQISEGSWLSDAPYGVIHMVASDGQVHGFLRNVLDFCEPQTSHLRIDTHHDNKIMQHVLEKTDSANAASSILVNGDPRLAYEKMLIRLMF